MAVDEFFEFEPGDRAPPPVRTRAFVISDPNALLVAFHLDDPNPERLRAPLVERDRVVGNQDFVQVEVDTDGLGRTSRFFRANPRGVIGDGLYSEAIGDDDLAPDYPFEVVTRRTAQGWAAVFRIPLGALPSPNRVR
jgi:hypothetical protein